MTRRRPTIRDVAARAGVSHQTVSRVINNDPRVSPETLARVEAAIAELAFQPNVIARSMARGRSHTLACLSPNLTDYTFASIIEGAETEARRHGYFMFTSSAAGVDDFGALIDQFVAGRRTDGLLVINPYIDDRYQRLPQRFPMVFIGAQPRQEPVSSVALDDAGAACAATTHLLALGHRAIASISGPLVEDCSQDRTLGYCQALRQAGLAPDPALMLEGDWSATSGYQAMQALAHSGHLPTAVLAQNDRMAVGVLRAARELGLGVPGQLSVMGIDDMPLASYLDPPLTTMRQDMVGIGRQAIQLLIEAIEQPGVSPQHRRLPAELVVRQTTQQRPVCTTT